MLSVRLSVCPSVCDLVDQDRIGWKSWKLTARSIRPTPSLFVGHPPNPRQICGNLGETRGGLGKSGVLVHKSGDISETRKGRGKLTTESLQEVTNALWNGTIPTPYGLPFPKIGVRNPTTKRQSLLSQEWVK